MKAIDYDWGLEPSEQGLPEVEGILEMLSTGERLTIRDIGQRWMDAGNEDISGCETGTYLLRIAVDGHPLYVEEDDDEVFYQLRYEGVEMPVEIFVRNDSIDECDIDLEFTNQSDRDHQRYIRADVAEKQLAAEREKREALGAQLESSFSALTSDNDPEKRYLDAYHIAVYQPPETSLAQRDARVAAEALRKAAETLEFKPKTSGWLHSVANQVAERGVASVFCDVIPAGGSHE